MVDSQAAPVSPSYTPPGPSLSPLEAAEHVASELEKTAIGRDAAGGTARAERALLRKSKLLNLLIPTEYGGGGSTWPEILACVRVISRADGSLGHLFGFQHLLLATLKLFGPEPQWSRYFTETVERDQFWGNALNPLDRRTTIRESSAGEFVVNGTKSFTSGANDSDMLVVSASPTGETRLVVAAIPSTREGLVIHEDWDNMGQRQTDSGSVEFHDVRVFDSEILKSPGPLGSVYASLRPCIAQLILANVYLGIGEGALSAARAYTKTDARVWFGAGVASQSADPYVLRHFGELHVELEAARLLTERAAEELERAWRLGDALTPEGRGAVAVAVASAKVKTTRTGLETATRIFETMGARATTRRLGFDRFWRNLRTHTLHDPVEYKLRELGNFALNDELPTPSFYS